MSDVLAMLVAQAEGRGVDLVTLRALIEESAELGARRALAKATPTRSAKTTQIGLVRRMVARCLEGIRPNPVTPISRTPKGGEA